MGDGIMLHRSNGWYPAFTFTPTDPTKAPGYEFVEDDVVFNYEAWKSVAIKDGTAIFENNGISITSTDDDAYTEYAADTFPTGARISVLPGEVIVLSWTEESNAHGNVRIYPNGSDIGSIGVDNANAKQLRYAVPNGVTFLTFRFGVAAFDRTIHYQNIAFHSVNKNWRIRFLTSGDLKFSQLNSARRGIDVFLVGGGGGGACSYSYTYTYNSFGSIAGGGSGYTKTQKSISLQKDVEYPIVIGVGGSYRHGSAGTAGSGTASSAFGYVAAGGTGGYATHDNNAGTGRATGGSGGSGAYAAAAVIPNNYNGHAGATDGNNSNGKGQRTNPGPNGETGTTREFGESTGVLYAQGGGSGNGTPQTENTGNGGNAGYLGDRTATRLTTDGCSGIVIIRNAR